MAPPLVKKERIVSIDMLRGLAIIFMVLDHVIKFNYYYYFDPTDISKTNIPFFLSRFITHPSAPIFVFLAGMGTGLAEIYGKDKKFLSRFLWTRGLWLIFLEFTVVRLAWNFDLTDKTIHLLVIWALGVCMIFLAVFIYLPKKWIWAIGLTMILGHNMVDGIQPESLGAFGPIWIILHIKSYFNIGPVPVEVLYPLIPWIGVMALGYVSADFYRLEISIRKKKMFIIGFLLTVLFFVFRGINLYGDPDPWTVQSTTGMTIVSFFNLTKYPPSLSFLLMTLGPSFMTLAVFENIKGWFSGFLVVFGRVPMFVYVVHLYVVHITAALLRDYQAYQWSQIQDKSLDQTPVYGFGLAFCYILWILITAALFPVSKWYMHFKKGKKSPIYSYI